MWGLLNEALINIEPIKKLQETYDHQLCRKEYITTLARPTTLKEKALDKSKANLPFAF